MSTLDLHSSNRPFLTRRIHPVLWFFCGVLLFIHSNLVAQTSAIDWAKKTVTSTMTRHSAGDLGIWVYWNGFYLLGQYRAWQTTDDPNYFQYIKNWVDNHVDVNGNIDQPLTSLDNFQPGLVTLLLYRETQEQKYKLAADRIRDVLRTYPRTSDGGFWHGAGMNGQLWLDGAYMVLPFLAEYGRTFGDTACYTEAANQILIDAGHLTSSSGLLYHGYDEDGSESWADPTTHHSPFFWGRSMGWFGMAMVEILDYLPTDHPLRPSVIQVLANLIEGLSQVQDETTGLWYQVVDKGDIAGNWLESSCSCMYSYIMDKAVEKGYVDGHYRTLARKAYEGILSNKVYLGSDGLINLTDISSGTNVSADYSYYVNRSKNVNDQHGLGAFLMMCLQMSKSETSQTWNFTVTVDPPGSGSVNPGSGIYADGNVLHLVAAPFNTSYTFDHWNDEANDILPNKTITMNSDRFLTAHFRTVNDNDVQVEAETGTMSQGTVDSNWPGFTGTGFANVANQTGSYLELAFTLPQPGNWDLRIRYANGSVNNRTSEIRVDGAGDTLDFPSTGNWETWMYSNPVTLNLGAGNHTLRVTGLTSESAPNIDHVSVQYVNSLPGKGVITGSIHDPGGECRDVQFTVTLYDASWNQIATQNYPDEPGNSWIYAMGHADYSFDSLSTGDYHVMANARVIHWVDPPYYWNKSPWIETYYSNSITHGGAALIHVNSPDTTKVVKITLRYASLVRIGTDPPNLPVTVDGAVWSSDTTFVWKEGDVHSIGVEAYHDNPDGSRSIFNNWKQGGSRTQNYTVPPGGFNVTVDSLIARFDTTASDSVNLVEAETGIMSQGTVDTNWPGFTGTGFANVANQLGSYLEMIFSLPQAGNWDIQIRYANGSVNTRTCEILVDGIRDTLDFPSTGDWVTWTYSNPVVFNLTAGTHTLRITGLTSESAPNIDHVKLTFASGDVFLILAANPPDGGYTSPPTGSHGYPMNTVVDITAIPSAESGYRFIHWTGDVADSSSETTTLTMNANKTVTAVFAADTSKGAIQLTLDYHQMAYHRGWCIIWLYDTQWNTYQSYFCHQKGEPFVIDGIIPGDYYFMGRVWVEDCKIGNGDYQPCRDPYIPEYYNNSFERNGATVVHVAAGDTTVLDPIWFDTEYETLITSSPVNLSGLVNAYGLFTPVYLSWAPGETYTLEFDETYDLPDGSRYVFDSWKHGGLRVQQYTKPIGIQKETLEVRYSLIYEAESGTLSQGTVDTEWPGFTGTGFANVANQFGSYLEMIFSLLQAGNWDIQIRYANGSVNTRTCEILVDGIRDTFDFPSTGDWVSWTYSNPVVFNLTAGTHTLRITGLTSESAPNIDHVQFLPSMTSSSEGAITGRITAMGGEYHDVAYKATLYDASWNRIFEKNYLDMEMGYADFVFDNLPAGDYYLMAYAHVVHWIDPPFHWNQYPWIETYYSNSIAHEGATLIQVVSPDTTKNINMTLRYASIILVGTDPPNYPVVVDGVECPADTHFVWKEADGHAISVEEYYDNPDGSRLIFNNWQQGGSRTQNVTVPPGIFNGVVDSLIARFDRCYQLEVQINDTTTGNVTVIPSGKWQIQNSTVTLKAVPEQGFHFIGWDGAVTGTEDSLSIAMDTTKILIARFASDSTDAVELKKGQVLLPKEIILMQNYPNPFNAETRIQYGIPKPGRVILSIHGLNGSCIRVLVDEKLSGGVYDTVWDGRDERGNPVSSGVYLFRLRGEERSLLKKVILVK